MEHTENWIWLPKALYPNDQTTVYSGMDKKKSASYTVAEFLKTYTFSKKIIKASLRFSGDAVFQLFANQQIIATGPAGAGGDFLGNNTPRKNFYSFEKNHLSKRL